MVILGGGGSQQPAFAPNQPPAAGNNLSGTLGSLFGGVLGGGGSHQPPAYQPSGGYGGYQPSSGYPASGGQSSGGSDLLSGIGSALFSSALDGLSKRGKDVNTCCVFSTIATYINLKNPQQSLITLLNSFFCIEISRRISFRTPSELRTSSTSSAKTSSATGNSTILGRAKINSGRNFEGTWTG